MGYKEDLNIDQFSLDAELVRQPSLYGKWAQAEIDAQDERDTAKDQLDVIKAMLDQEIRANAVESGERVTEASIANTIVLDQRYRAQMALYLEKTKTAKSLGVARESLEHKRRSLGKLVDLYVNQYWAESPELAAKTEAATEMVRKAVCSAEGRIRKAKETAAGQKGEPSNAKLRRRLDS